MNKILYWFTTGCAVVALVLIVTNICLIKGNQQIQQDIAFKQNIINTAVNVSPLNQQLAQALYDAGAKAKDQQILALLKEQGIEADKQMNKEQPKDEAKAPAPAKAKAKKAGEE